MRTETTTRDLYKYEELSDKAKENAREWHRRASAEDTFFAESVIEDFVYTVAPCFGWTVEAKQVCWSGFSCQGDGASFSGIWRSNGVSPARLAAECPTDERLASIMVDMVAAVKLFEVPEGDYAYVRVGHSGHYSHSNCTDFEFDGDISLEAEQALKDASRALMNWLYRTLEKEYVYVNSDEVVGETIEANDYEFTIDGSRA